jgi:excisionase family DNA binding protein
MDLSRRYFKTKDIAQYLGMTESAIRKWIRTGQIPFCRINGGIRFEIK